MERKYFQTTCTRPCCRLLQMLLLAVNCLLCVLAFCHVIAATGSASGGETALAAAAVLRVWSARSRDGDYR